MLLDIIQDKNKLQVSYWGEGGNTKFKFYEIPSKEWYDYSFNSNDLPTNEINWDSKPLFKKPLDLRNKGWFSKNRLYEVFESVTSDEDKKEIFSYNLPNCFFVDIETEVTDGIPDPNKAKEAITVIGICNKTTVYMLSIKDLSKEEIDEIEIKMNDYLQDVTNKHYNLKFKYFEHEFDMLSYFVCKMVPKMALITGWNFTRFDWTYIKNRCKRFKIDFNETSPTKKINKNGIPNHVAVCDYLEVYQKWTWNTNENFKLDTIAEKIVGAKKIQHNESLQDMYENNFNKYVLYNAIDCVLVQLIHEKCGALDVGLTTAWLTNSFAMKCFSATYLHENNLRQLFKQHNKHVVYDRNNDDATNEGTEGYEGAFVKQPIPGMHSNLICNDFASLYPSIMREFNMSPEAFVAKKDIQRKVSIDIRTKLLIEKGCILTASGAIYKNDFDSITRITLNDLYGKRKSYKKESFKWKQIYYDAKKLLEHNASDKDVENFLNEHS